MDAEQPSASSSAISNEAEQHPRRPPCPRCSSLETRFCYLYAGGRTNTRRPKHFCLSCNRFWVEGEENLVPLRTAANTSGDSCAAADADARCSSTPPHSKRIRRLRGAAEQPLLPCPRCGSTNTRFLKYMSKGRSRPQHFCFSCSRGWLVGGASLKGWSWGDEKAPPPPVERPRCPLCGSHCTRSSGFRDARHTKRTHKCLRCNRSWTRQVDGWAEAEAVPAEAEPAPATYSSRSDPSQPEAQSSRCWEGGDGCSVRRGPAEHIHSTIEVNVGGGGGGGGAVVITKNSGASASPLLMAEAAAASAAQETKITDTGASASSDLMAAAAAVGSAEAEDPTMDLFWKPGEERKLTWEDIERIDYVLGQYLRAPFSGGDL